MLYKHYLVCALCVLYAGAYSQNIGRIEYFFNSDPGFGNGIALSGYTASPDVSNFTTSLNVSALPNGVNTLFLRAKDANDYWSITNVIPFVKANVAIPSSIVRAEYFLNTDPGFGNGTSFALPASSNINQQAVTFNVAAATAGLNTLFVRVQDSTGNWSLTNTFPFVKGSVAGNIIAGEYFIDADPGFGMGLPISIVPAPNISNYTFSADISSAAIGNHTMYVRVKDAAGSWSLTNVVSFYKTTNVGITQVTDLAAGFTVYPNPGNDQFYLDFAPTQKVDNIELMDVQGKIIKVQSATTDNGKQVDIRGLTPGNYFIRILSGEDIIYKKVLISK